MTRRPWILLLLLAHAGLLSLSAIEWEIGLPPGDWLTAPSQAKGPPTETGRPAETGKPAAPQDDATRQRYLVELKAPPLGQKYTKEQLYPKGRGPKARSSRAQGNSRGSPAQAAIDREHRLFAQKQIDLKNAIAARRGQRTESLSPEALMALGTRQGHFKIIMNAFAIELTDDEVTLLLQNPDVIAIHPDVQFEAAEIIDYNAVTNSDDIHNLGYTGAGVKVAVIDTGINYTHPDFGGCTTQEFLSSNCAKVIGGWDYINDDADPYDDNGHGTQSASVVSANGVVKGVAPDSHLLVYKAGSSLGGFASSAILLASEQALLDGADVITLSVGLGGSNPLGSTQKAIDAVVKNGITYVIGAGNQGDWGFESITSLGSTLHAITVGAYDGRAFEQIIPTFSGRGLNKWGYRDENQTIRYVYSLKPDLVAPGVNLCTAYYKTGVNNPDCPTDQHGSYGGTSAATPVVAGIAALLVEKNPTWTPEQIKSALRNTATNLDQDYRIQGLGLVNALAAFNLNQAPPAGLFRAIRETATSYEFNATIKGPNFQGYKIFIGEGIKPSTYTLFTQGTDQFDEEIVTYIPYEKLPAGNFTVKLEVTGTDGFIVRDYFPHECTDALCGTNIYNCLNPPANANVCPGDDRDLAQDTDSSLVSACADQAKCEFVCNEGFLFSNGLCVPAPVCTGAVPTNAALCPGDDLNLTQDTPNTLVSACAEPIKCEYTCNAGYTFQNGECVPDIAGQCGPGMYRCQTGSLIILPGSEGIAEWRCDGQGSGADALCQSLNFTRMQLLVGAEASTLTVGPLAAGKTYTVQKSLDLANWETAAILSLDAPLQQFTFDLGPGTPSLFYRILATDTPAP